MFHPFKPNKVLQLRRTVASFCEPEFPAARRNGSMSPCRHYSDFRDRGFLQSYIPILLILVHRVEMSRTREQDHGLFLSFPTAIPNHADSDVASSSLKLDFHANMPVIIKKGSFWTIYQLPMSPASVSHRFVRTFGTSIPSQIFDLTFSDQQPSIQVPVIRRSVSLRGLDIGG